MKIKIHNCLLMKSDKKYIFHNGGSTIGDYDFVLPYKIGLANCSNDFFVHYQINEIFAFIKFDSNTKTLNEYHFSFGKQIPTYTFWRTDIEFWKELMP